MNFISMYALVAVCWFLVTMRTPTNRAEWRVQFAIAATWLPCVLFSGAYSLVSLIAEVTQP